MSKEKDTKETIVKESKGKESGTKRNKALTVVGIILCVIMLPILIVNVTMIIKSYTNPDEYPSFAGYTLMIVLSPSMEDTIKSGDLILVKSAEPEDIEGESSAGAQDGDIISFFDPESEKKSVLTHRCKTVQETDGSISFITKGDNNNSEDATACPSENLIGTYVTRIPGGGSVAMWLQTTPGLIVCVAVPIVLLVAYDLIMKKRYDKTKKKDTDALLAELESLRAQQAETDNKEEAKAEASDEEAVQADAEKKDEQPEKDPESDDSEDASGEKSDEETADEKSDDKSDEVKAEEKSDADPDEKEAEKDSDEKKEEKSAEESDAAPEMTAEELEEFREFQRMKKAKKNAKDKKES